jgi:short-subunit dehydrogenase
VELEGKRLLLSGATGGLGRAIAEALAAEGAELVLSSRRKEDLEELAGSLPGGARRHQVIVADLAEEGMAEQLVSDSGDLDGLIANAGLPASGRLERFSQRELARAIKVNLEAPIRMTRELLPSLLEKRDGHLLFVSSLNGQYATARSSLYSATKFGLRGFAFGLREDLYDSGIGVSVVSPGLVRGAGLFAESGARAPILLGTTTPRKVAKAVVKAIRRNRSEISVAPLRQRRLSKFASHHPELAGRITRRPSAHSIAESVAAGQADKR